MIDPLEDSRKLESGANRLLMSWASEKSISTSNQTNSATPARTAASPAAKQKVVVPIQADMRTVKLAERKPVRPPALDALQRGTAR